MFVYLAGNITTISQASLQGMTSVTSLKIHSTVMQDVPNMYVLRNSLTELTIKENTQLVNAPIEIMVALKKLTIIDMSETGLTDVPSTCSDNIQGRCKTHYVL